MITFILSFLLAGLLALYIYVKTVTAHMVEHSEKISGPKTIPLLGNALEFGLNRTAFYDNINRLVNAHWPLVRVWLGTKLLLVSTDPKHIEVVINSSKHITKAFFYDYLMPWLGTGLLTSTGHKWKVHRKIITPTFHFKILEKYVDVFNKNGHILIERLSEKVNGPVFDICPYITEYTLDVICETAMGVTVNSQRGENKDYVEAVRNMGMVAVSRSFKPWLYPDFIFNLSSYGRLQKRSLVVLHNMTNSVIRTRKMELSQMSKSPKPNCEENDIGIKRRSDFLDLLIHSSTDDNNKLSDEELREEVDTFMFEGHDTTSSAIFFSVWTMANHPDVQEKVYEELKRMFGDSDRDPTYNDLQDMKYLDQVVKETLRFYPSVPLFGRELMEDVSVDGYTFPKGTNFVFQPQTLHMNPDHWPNPKKFDPDRFLPENSVGRHAYSYIPFSAGPRNCIGQKFAMAELKATLSKLVRNFKFTPGDPEEDLGFFAELILTSKTGVRVKIESR